MSIYLLCLVGFFFFKQKTAYELRISDWSSDVCSSDLIPAAVDADAGDCEVDVHDLGGAIDGDLQVCLVDDLEVVGENGRTGNCGAHVARGLFGDGHRSMPACGRPRGDRKSTRLNSSH